MQDAHRPTSVKEAAAAIISRCQTQIALLQNDIALAKKRLDDPKYNNMSEADRVANESEIFHRKQLPTTTPFGYHRVADFYWYIGNTQTGFLGCYENLFTKEYIKAVVEKSEQRGEQYLRVHAQVENNITGHRCGYFDAGMFKFLWTCDPKTEAYRFYADDPPYRHLYENREGLITKPKG